MIFSAEYLIAQPEPQLTTNDGCWLSIPFLSFSCEEEIDLSLIDRLAFSLLSFIFYVISFTANKCTKENHNKYSICFHSLLLKSFFYLSI